MSQRGRLLIFEGPDETGKSTLSQELANTLADNGIPCTVLSFPGKEEGTLGRLVYDLHHEPDRFGVRSMDPASLQLLHVAAHLDVMNRRILPDLAAGKWIVLDRFWWSTWVYGVVSGVSKRSLRSMLRVEKDLWRTILPTCMFLIRRDQTPGQSRSGARLRAEYDHLARKEAVAYPVRIIQNDGSIADAIRDIVGAVCEETGVSDLHHLCKLQMELPTPGDLQQAASGQQVLAPETKTCTGNLPHPTILSRLSRPQPTKVFDTYWRFAAERQAIFFRRFRREAPPWTTDRILQRHKFTNAYRASDRISQHLIKNIIYEGDQSPEETFFRTVLFKVFNRISTWELLRSELPEVRYSEYTFDKYDQVLSRAMDSGVRIFSAAYLMPSGSGDLANSRKHRSYMRLVEQMMKDNLPGRIAEARSMCEAYELILAYPMMGSFLAYQYATDLNYSTLIDFSEMDFVVPGPGAKSGIRKCFVSTGDMTEADIIRWVTERQHQEFERLDLHFESLWGRPLQLIDCQNLFCEVDKYARIAHPDVTGVGGRTRIKQSYNMIADPIDYWYPPKWGLNDLIRGGQ
jgi:thymidylate kinase